MAGFNFEKNLEHQQKAVDTTVKVFDGLDTKEQTGTEKHCKNPILDKDASLRYVQNIGSLQEQNNIERKVNGQSNIIDIMMETGTGKTYTYTKTIFELNKYYGIFKFVVVVPTLSIKAGTIDFLKSESSREHFREQYGKTLNLHIVESQKGGKSKKSYLPPAVSSFVSAGTYEKNQIQVLIINAGMINSETMQKSFDTTLFDTYSVPFHAISATNPFMIIDEPHKFSQSNKTWENIQQMKPQFILRYGATFQGYENLVYTLTAVDSFNRNLVKGVIGHITEFEGGKNAMVKFVASDGTEATFEIIEGEKKESKKLGKKESLEKIHSAMEDLIIESINKSTVILSNGLELKKGDKLNPYSYSETLQETMIQKAVQHHFELEKKFLKRDVKIKPLTLFFIDNIEEYRGGNGYIRKTVEKYIRAEVKQILKTEEVGFYRLYLEKTLEDVSKTHGGYFSKDNSEKDEAIEKEVIEILHDKQAMLNLENPRRFIFSKWTLREGWDNPNVFQICKLRSSGSDISKLQEVGRGLRLPVNEYGNRVKDEQFYLNYFVDFTESDFVDSLVNEINEKSGAISLEEVPEKLHDQMIKQIIEKYDIKNEDDFIDELVEKGIIRASHKFKEGGFDFIKHNYPLIFEGVGSTKIRKSTDEKKKVAIRIEKYSELKELWEKLNEKVILEYKIENEDEFKKLFVVFLQEYANAFSESGLKEKTVKVEIEDDRAVWKEEITIQKNEIERVCTMRYSDFLKQLSNALYMNMKTLHKALVDSGIEINSYLNATTIRTIKQKFGNYLMYNAIDAFEIEYKKVTNTIHPTKLTNENGGIKNEINASDIGILYSDERVSDNYLFEKLFYDSELEKENIQANIQEVIIFTKIPKNSIKIPVAGGKSYSPDFAYVLNFEDGKTKLYFIVETKNAEGESLRPEEKQKIRHAKRFFGNEVNIRFEKQFKGKKMVDLINEVYSQKK